MKKLICLQLALCLLLCGCGINNVSRHESESSTEASTESGKPVFMLENLPDIGEYSTKTYYKRWYKEYTDTLKPRSDYGELIPFIGDCRYYEEADVSGDEKYGFYSSLYGLMTTDGTVVVDAVYESIDEVEVDGVIYYALVKSIPFKHPEGWHDSRPETTITKTDGSKAFTVSGHAYNGNNGRIVVGDEYGEVLKVYDYDGNFIFKIPEGYSSFGEYNENLLCCTQYNDYDYKTIVYDIDGNVVLELNGEIWGKFENGKAIVCIPNFFSDIPDSYGIINARGEWLIQPVCRSINRLKNGYYAVKGFGKLEILDENLISLNKTSDTEHWYNVVGEKVIYSKGDYYYDAFTDEPIICKENGMQATNYLYEIDCFTVKDGNDIYIFDGDGNTVAKLENAEEIYELDETLLYTTWDNGTHRTEIYYDYSGNEVLALKYDYKKGYKSVEYSYRPYRFLVVCSQENNAISEYRIFDREKKEYLDSLSGINCRAAEVFQSQGKLYISMAFDEYVCVYDEDLNIVFKAGNQYTD